MSAILSADDLNDFISPGVACIKPVETLPRQNPAEKNDYEVLKDGQQPQEKTAAQISLTDCLACSGCVTSAEAVLISLQSHTEVLNSLNDPQGRIFVASVSPQVRASIAATYGVSEREAGWMIDQLLAGDLGLSAGHEQHTRFQWVVDTNVMREAVLAMSAEEVLNIGRTKRAEGVDGTGTSASFVPKKPILSSACPGWICYAEKTHPHVLPHLSRLKSPQALTGTLLKTVLSKNLNVKPDKIWHLSVMPCFDKKLEASREELTDVYWRQGSLSTEITPIRDVDCVITARELLMLADTRGISFPNLPRLPLNNLEPFPDSEFARWLFPPGSSSMKNGHRKQQQRSAEAGSSGGFLYHILRTQLAMNPDSTLITTRGRNADVIEYTIQSSHDLTSDPIFKGARYYGFRNIQNLVRKLKPPRRTRMPGSSHRVPTNKASATPSNNTGVGGATDFAYVEVMACPGGCTNGGGQIKIDDLPSQSAVAMTGSATMTQKEWLQRVDEAYFSMSDNEDSDSESGSKQTSDPYEHSRNENDSSSIENKAHINHNSETNINPNNKDIIDGISHSHIKEMLDYWSSSTGIPLDKLIKTSYRKVESDVGRGSGAGSGENNNNNSTERVVELAGKIGGGW